MQKKPQLGALSCALLAALQVQAANYDATTNSITLNNIQGLNKNAPTFNTGATKAAWMAWSSRVI